MKAYQLPHNAEQPMNSVLVLRRGKESLWIQTDTDGIRKYFVTMSRVGTVDYPMLVNGRTYYDLPEDLTAPFKAIVREHLKSHSPYE